MYGQAEFFNKIRAAVLSSINLFEARIHNASILQSYMPLTLAKLAECGKLRSVPSSV